MFDASVTPSSEIRSRTLRACKGGVFGLHQCFANDMPVPNENERRETYA